MTLNDALNQIIDDGIEAARQDYSQPKDHLKLAGAIQGFEECRGKTPEAIQALIDPAMRRAQSAMLCDGESVEAYWFWRCRAAEIEWVANVLSCILVAQGAQPIYIMTVTGGIKASEIIGVKA